MYKPISWLLIKRSHKCSKYSLIVFQSSFHAHINAPSCIASFFHFPRWTMLHPHHKCICTYVHMCMGPNVYKDTQACLSTCKWRSEIDIRCLHWTLNPLLTEAESLTELGLDNSDCSSWTACYAVWPSVSTWLLHVGIKGGQEVFPAFIYVWGSELQSPYSMWQVFYPLSHLPAHHYMLSLHCCLLEYQGVIASIPEHFLASNKYLRGTHMYTLDWTQMRARYIWLQQFNKVSGLKGLFLSTFIS